jgi:hypothetical protein
MRFANDAGFGVLKRTHSGLVFALGCLVSHCAVAHTSLEAYVRENISISVGRENIDVRIQFSFPADLSLKERQTMDRDGNGKLSKEEKAAYLDDIQAQAERLLQLSINGTRATLIPLADPELDLEDASNVEDHPHELRLAYFARVPKDFGVGGAITLDSGLWTNAPLMVSVATAGADGTRFQTTDKKGLRPPSKDAALFRVTEARCTRWEFDSTKNGRR